MTFVDQREWMAMLEEAGELVRVKVPVDWTGEIGAICRKAALWQNCYQVGPRRN